MPNSISFRTINVNASSQNCGVFVGDVRVSGFDASSKSNAACASLYGFHNFEQGLVNITVDYKEVVDGVIQDQDTKIVRGRHV